MDSSLDTPSTKVDNSLQTRRVMRLEADNRWHAAALDLLFDMGALYGDTFGDHDIANVLEASFSLLTRVLDLRRSGFLLANEVSAEFDMVRCFPESARTGLRVLVDQLIDSGDFAWALNRNQVQQVLAPGAEAPVVLNVIATRNRIRGMLIAEPEPGQRITPACAKLISVLMHHCAYALESASLYQLVDRQKQRLEVALQERSNDLEYQSRHDTLTGLANRAAFMESLEQALVEACLDQSQVIAVYLELAQFKRIRASYGYAAGDRLLIQVAQRVGRVIAGNEQQRRLGPLHEKVCSARMGGEAFAVMLPGIRHFDTASAVVEVLSLALQAPFDLDGTRIYVDHSVGLSAYPEFGADAESMVREAMVACGCAREAGRNQALLYRNNMRDLGAPNLLLEAELREALDSDQLVVHYQPKIDLHNARVCGAEALVRWQHPKRGLVAPGEFIELAETSGLIEPLGEVVLAKVCRQAQVWRERLGMDFRLAFNLSPCQFRQPDLVERVASSIARNGASPQWLELEVTETAMTQDVDLTAAALEQFHRSGLSLAIDDFGTGYSSLALIKRFPIDTLKIDRSFVRDLQSSADDAAIVAAIIAMGHQLRLRVVAEGVETAQQLDTLQALGCDEVQGYFLGRPMRPDDFEAFWIERETRFAG